MTSVYCAVRTGSLNRTTDGSSLKGLSVLRDYMEVSSHVYWACKYVGYSNVHMREVPHVTAVDYTGTKMKNRECVASITGKKVTCRTVTETEQQGFADVAAGTLLCATLPKTNMLSVL